MATDLVEVALNHYGPVIHRGQVWYAGLKARIGRVNNMGYGGQAKNLPWPPEPPDPKPPPVVEQKIAGPTSYRDGA